MNNVLLWSVLLLLFGSSGLALLALTGWQQPADVHLWQDPWFWQVLRFTLWQALLSALISVVLALPLARVLALDLRLPGKAAFLRWCLLCFVMPSLILITGLVVMFGYSGWLTPLFTELFHSGWSLYGLTGILLAHVFLNLPLALRVLSAQWGSIPTSAWKMAAQLQLTGFRRFLLLEWPALRGVLPALFGFIFLLCFNSFAVVLALGGGPAASTLEVAIFQALKYHFNPSEALFLAWTQLLLAGGLFWLISRWGKLQWLAAPSGESGWRPVLSGFSNWIGRGYYLMVLLFLTLPVLSLVPAIISRGWARLPWSQLWLASSWSLFFALAASLLALLMALLLAWVACGSRQKTSLPSFIQPLATLAALHHLVVPGMVLSVGLYIFFMGYINWLDWGWLAVIWLNALVALPFAFSQLKPAVFAYRSSYQRLASSLQLSPWLHWRRVILPCLQPALLRVTGLCLVLTLGDFAIFGIFGQAEHRTLPWLIHELAGAYRLGEAALASLWLLALAFTGLWLLDRGVVIASLRGNAEHAESKDGFVHPADK
ncbi:MAG: thiamine/thiamine pyrophosphate ABC transporter permease ThiP [Marinospirillum sp.]|uniref:thiamine/thiamine pyrophosphate ABC transporter permease ThiP n=1 Tax=Marinospirillum sp. TaxID=2183934 RepID=UPI0019D990D4|nr:thiamine/thiamine pyrophosphate ABC transporter permease ThiP [Marinospirillum sp.]MBE0508153.1 thiamine/thiamine pyrophosphate ABC transporter permease ThiP [Marinospirillum sp.]